MRVEVPSGNLPNQEIATSKPSHINSAVAATNLDSASTRPLIRLNPQATSFAIASLARRRNGALLMALAGIASLAFRRLGYDSGMVILLELAVAAILIFVVGPRSTAVAIVSLLSLPWLTDFVARISGAGNAKEIVMLNSLAWGAVACAVFGTTRKSISMSVVCSGFLTLFVTFISDTLHASWFAYAWGVVCLWWLISNHWDEVQSQAATHVQSLQGYRLASLAAGCALFFLLTIALANRLPVLSQSQHGFMPTSGGASQKDSVGRGVGNGDALVSALNNPSSFGAVDTDMFLESNKPSLFDVVSEESGFPRRVRRVERAQSLQGSKARVKAGRFSEANQYSGAEFTTSRDAPKLHKDSKDIIRDSLMFWAGQPYAHLAVERYSDFDGLTWFNSEPNALRLQSDNVASTQRWTTPRSINIDEQAWFFSSEHAFPNDQSPYVEASAESLKFTRFRSPVIPARLGLQMWSIDMLDRADFFGIDRQGLVFLPDRIHVPDFTVVRMAGSKIDLEKVEGLLSNTSIGTCSLLSEAAINVKQSESLTNAISTLATELAGDQPRGWSQVSEVISGFRQRFNHNRDWIPPPSDENQTPIEKILKTNSGPAHLIATAATLVLRQLGYETRLAVGFYANPKNMMNGVGEIAILPSDSHIWVEIHVGNGYWISLEPTEGYHPERMTVGFWYRLKQFKVEIASLVGCLVVVGVLGFFWRGYMLEFLSLLVWPVVKLMNDRRLVAWLARLLDLRAQFAGYPRNRAVLMRSHFRSLLDGLSEEMLGDWQKFLSASDRLIFGGQTGLTREERLATGRVWKGMTYHWLCRATRGKDDE